MYRTNKAWFWVSSIKHFKPRPAKYFWTHTKKKERKKETNSQQEWCAQCERYFYEALRSPLHNPEVLHRYFNTIPGSFGTRDSSFCTRSVFWQSTCVPAAADLRRSLIHTRSGPIRPSDSLLGWKSALGADRLSSMALPQSNGAQVPQALFSHHIPLMTRRQRE